MFENLSNREKKLLLVIGTLVPIVLIFFGIIRMTSALKTNQEKIDSLDLQFADQEAIKIEGMAAERRQAYYANASLHPSINIASFNYQDWIKSTITESGMTWTSVSPTPGSRIRSDNETIGESWLIKVNAKGRLPEFNDFLSKFYQIDMLHRIKTLTLTPDNEPRTTTRDGFITIKMDLEILSLKAGEKRDGFDGFRTNLANSETNYDAILRRNIFGPRNSEPVITAPNKTTVAGRGKPYSFSITAKDANKNDLLTFELLDSSVKGATLEQADTSAKRAKFEIPDVPAGEYMFTVKVSDNGFPAKSSTKEFAVNVKKKSPPPTRDKTPDPKPPKLVDYIRLVKVTGIVKHRDGKWRVWLSIGPTGERPQLTVGETFEVGKKKYEVVSIDQDKATFAGDEKTFVAIPDFETRGAFVETKL